MMASFGLLALAIITPLAQEVADIERFELFNNCEPMHLVILGASDDDEDVKKIGLTKEGVQFAVESRLRGARLFKSDLGLPALEVSVNVRAASFAIALRYNKYLFDYAAGIDGLAQTWGAGTFGAHGASAEYIVSSLSELLDKFLTEYLRVNESACTESPQPPTQ